MSKKPNFMERGLVVQPNSKNLAPENQKVLDRLAALVGFVAISLPLIMIIGGTVGGSCFRDSISHFYHAQFLGGFFVGLLFFIGGFLLAYSGDHWMETIGSTIAGLGAFGVALFPTAGAGCEAQTSFLSRVFVNVSNKADNGVYEVTAVEQGQRYFELFGAASEYHMIGAGIVFIYLGLFCIIVLRRVIPEKHGAGTNMVSTKRARNAVYFWCGVIILFSVAVLGLKGRVFDDDLVWWNSLNLTFWVELVALWAFGFAWIIKGRIFARLNDDVIG
ncbi:DUF998 domain-containing protein [Arenicella sp. 4NH20-0111]|uniref:hypothetical protein n=1 Tax=Arenicella sp. 4NH20-0111 TaxID=3127648 RepID=UPI003101CB30